MRTPRPLALASATCLAVVGLSATPALADPSPNAGAAAPQAVQTQFSDEELRIMADSSGRTVEEQIAHLEDQEQQNNAYASLHADGHDFDGAYFDQDNELVVQAEAGSTSAQAAESADLEVRSAEHGADHLDDITEELTTAIGADGDVASIAPDVERDAVVVTVLNDEGQATVTHLAAEYGDEVVIERGEPNRAQATVTGGDELRAGDNYCSAGFPATDGSADYMIWTGHCIEGMPSVSTASGEHVGSPVANEFVSYDGEIDRDMGLVALDDAATMERSVDGANRLDASQGAWQAPIGTDACKSGAATGISCGEITGYNSTVIYADADGNVHARAVGLGEADICTAPGDSGGTIVAGGYAVGMTSGGFGDRSCGATNGDSGGTSYFQPVTDVLDFYGLQYAG